jgi:hypothetical protein
MSAALNVVRDLAEHGAQSLHGLSLRSNCFSVCGCPQ